jgi:tetratricopeptide (TPR) repeat protein
MNSLQRAVILVALTALPHFLPTAAGQPLTLDAPRERWWQAYGALFEQAREQLLAGHPASAAETFSRALPASPYAAIYNRGLCRFALDQLDLAQHDFQGALALAQSTQQRITALAALAATQLRQGAIDASLATLQSAAREPGGKTYDVLLNLAYALEARAQVVAAYETLEAALELRPSTRSHFATLLEIFHDRSARAQGRTASAFQTIHFETAAARQHALDRLETVLQLRPDYLPARRQLELLWQQTLAAGEERYAERAQRLLETTHHARSQPAAWLPLEPIAGAPTADIEVRRWDDYAGRWELLVLVLVVWTILLCYLRAVQHRRIAEIQIRAAHRSRNRSTAPFKIPKP